MSDHPVAPIDLRPLPIPTETTAFYWQAAREHRLVLQRCGACTRLQYPPDVACVHCQCTDLVPTEVSGTGSLYSFAVLERPFHPGFADHLPYVVALVELDDQPGLRMLTNIVDATPPSLSVGQRLEVTFEDRARITLPQFRPAASAGGRR